MKKDKLNIKKFVIINSILIFLLGFITHNLYEWIPSFITVIFPVNESLFEHLKLIFITPIIISLIWYVYNCIKKIKYNNYFLALMISVVANIIIFYAIYLPIYYAFGQSMIVTLIIYFISIVISQIINAKILNSNKDNYLLNIVSILILVLIFVILIYLTYYPILNDFFLDPTKRIYGIPK